MKGCCCRPSLKYATRTQDTTYEGISCKAKVVHVIDGDTVRLVFPLFGRRRGSLVQYVCRISGLDTPELRPSLSHPNREFIQTKAREAKNALQELIGDSIVHVTFGKNDKYGRKLVRVFALRSRGCFRSTERICVKQWMIEHEYGVSYNGGSKK